METTRRLAIFRINYKSDFVLTLQSDAGWNIPFCIKFWTSVPTRAYYAGWDGTTYTHCAPVAGDSSKLQVQFDDHNLPIGELKYQIGYHFTVDDFPNDPEDEVINQEAVIIDNNGRNEKVLLDFNGETAPDIQFSLPAYANEAQRIANEQQRIENEQQRISNEETRILHEWERQRNEQTRITQEEARERAFTQMQRDSESATSAANDAATLANSKARLAQEKAEYAQQQGDFAKAQGETAQLDHTKAAADHQTALADHQTAAADHQTTLADHQTAAADHQTAEADHTRAGQDHTDIQNAIAAADLVYDISKAHASGGVLATYADLSAALGTNGANVPVERRQGGMVVQFVRSSDNNYVQYMYKLEYENTTDGNQAFINANNWEKVNLEDEVSQLGQNFNNLDKFLWANATSNLDVDTNNKAFVFKNNTYIHIGGTPVSIPQNTSVSYASFTTGSLFGLVYENGSVAILPWGDCIGKMLLAAFVLSFGDFTRMTFSVLPYTIDGNYYLVTKEQFVNSRQNYLVGGFTQSSINIDNTNKKFVWSSPLYFRIDGKGYTVPSGELAFSSWTGNQTALALVVELGQVTSDPNVYSATLAIKGNTSGYPNSAMGHYVVAWFFRSGSSWNAGPVVSVYSDLPFTIDGKTVTDVAIESFEQKIKREEELSASPEFPIGVLVNRSITASGLGDESTTRASQETLFAVPYNGCKITCRFNTPKLEMGIRSGAESTNLATNYYWMKDGDSYTIPANHNYYRVSFAIEGNGSSYADINASDIMTSMAQKKDVVLYEKKDEDIITRSYDSDTFVKAVILNFDSSITGQGMKELPLFAHITDAHGDITRIGNAVKYAKYIGVDALLATGDFVANNISDNFAVIETTLMENDNIPSLYCRGNHETYGNSDTSLNVYSKYYAALADKYGYEITEGKTYYYKDFSAKKVRVISVDPYEDNLTTNNTAAYSQAQINWFIATIKSTPQDYGIVVIMHSPESVPYSSPSITPISGKDKFFLDGTPLYWSTPKGLSLPPLMKIMDAFISRGTLNTTFTETTQSGQATISIDADFTSGIATGVEFIAWVCGHQHLDLIGEYDRTAYGLSHRQLVLDVTCATALYGPDSYPYLNNVSDLPRGGIGVVQDAITVYAIDRANKEVRIARCGSRFSNKLVERNCMVVSYMDEVL